MGAFKAYDIRGIYGKDFNKEDVYKIGYFLVDLLNTDRVLLGRDVRVSSPEIYAYLTQGMIDAGADVYDLGICTTPMVYWVSAKFEFSASVMITASHNPKEYNGLKISRENALPIGYDTGLAQIERALKERLVLPKPASEKGKVIAYSQEEAYLAFLQSYQKDVSELKLVIDCSNGMAGLYARRIFGSAPYYIWEELDGSFPNHEANPLEAENRYDLEREVRKRKADLGIIFDGDADRVMFVDENGKFISPDLIIAILAHYFLEEKALKGNVLQDIRSSKAVGEYIESLGSTMHMWKVGRAHAALKLREIDGIFGGELAGHYYFRDFYYSDSGILAAILVSGIFADLKKQGIKVSQAIDKLAKYANSGELNFTISRKEEAMEKLKSYFMETEKPEAIFDFDGYRLEFKKWWFNIRPSNTEPYLRLIVEAENSALLEEKVQCIKNLIADYQ